MEKCLLILDNRTLVNDAIEKFITKIRKFDIEIIGEQSLHVPFGVGKLISFMVKEDVQIEIIRSQARSHFAERSLNWTFWS